MKKQTLPDILAPNLKVIFCGLNPGLSSAIKGHHFMNKSTRFWKTLHLAGFTKEIIESENDHSLLNSGYGITSAASRATKKASDLTKGDFKKEANVLEKKILKYKPEFIAFLGKAAYTEISGNKNIIWGPQEESFGGSKVWVLPNPSGLNRNFSLQDLIKSYAELKKKI